MNVWCWQALSDRRTSASLCLQWVKQEDDEVLENALNALKSTQGHTGKACSLLNFPAPQPFEGKHELYIHFFPTQAEIKLTL